ncbi:AraC family transcriptional regulator ligand-binding domain-containing protein [Phormidium sp. LEGE 05292]|uniref:AraC family transcriptional regulator n=1 Tax=[Phormidium] sp. LEGE 05292 TaxID=767427 RepID=UPI00187F7B37|nr:AraC family transcriptional regulator [Phormidium sp. LEGE 05292]MBE9224555.1 AraC family transcriptional regulator ligand-binding domain-containing protein [Phormidium sp. LEGE 05292]
MIHIPLIRANVIHGVITLLQQLDAPTESLLAEAKLPASILHDPEVLLPLKQVLQFIENTALKEGMEQFGLLAGQKAQVANLGALGRLLSHSLTLYDAVDTLIRLVPSYNSGDRIWLNQQGENVWLCRRFINNFETDHPQAIHYSLMLLINLIQLAAGLCWMPTEIHLTTPHSWSLVEMELFSNTKILFNQDETAIIVPKNLLNLPLHNFDEYDEQQRNQDYEILYSSTRSTNFATLIRQIIGIELKQGYPKIQSTAEILGISVRSFQRQLNKCNLTYSHLVEQVRFELATQLLRDPTNKVTDIAAEIGYKDVGNFTRAFKRWAGVSPRAYLGLAEKG